MSTKKKRNSSEKLLKSAVDDLTSVNPETMFGPLMTPKKVGSLYGEDRTLPLGIESKSSVMRPREAVASFDDLEKNQSHNQFQSGSNPNEATIVSSDRQFGAEALQTSSSESGYSDKTVVVGKNKNYQDSEPSSAVEEKISFGAARSSLRPQNPAYSTGTDVQLLHAESLRVAQERLTALEKENEKLRTENEELFSASTMAKEKIEDLTSQLEAMDREKSSQAGQFQSELNIVKDKAVHKDVEINKLRQKVTEFETRLRQDLRKIRVRERELENRLELTKMEKETLLRAKDEAILELKRKLDHLQSELEGYRHRVADLNSRVEGDHQQLSRTVRALRLALTNLESGDSVGSITMAPFKKAE